MAPDRATSRLGQMRSSVSIDSDDKTVSCLMRLTVPLLHNRHYPPVAPLSFISIGSPILSGPFPLTTIAKSTSHANVQANLPRCRHASDGQPGGHLLSTPGTKTGKWPGPTPAHTVVGELFKSHIICPTNPTGPKHHSVGSCFCALPSEWGLPATQHQQQCLHGALCWGSGLDWLFCPGFFAGLSCWQCSLCFGSA